MADDDLPDAARVMSAEVWENPGEAYVGTCDAGSCDGESLAIVLTDEGWISMCDVHAVRALDPTSDGSGS